MEKKAAGGRMQPNAEARRLHELAKQDKGEIARAFRIASGAPAKKKGAPRVP